MTRKLTIELDIEEIGMLHRALAVYLSQPSVSRRDMEVIDRINKQISPPAHQACWTFDLKESGEVTTRIESDHRKRYRAWWEQSSHESEVGSDGV